jgi:hypothetical protein
MNRNPKDEPDTPLPPAPQMMAESDDRAICSVFDGPLTRELYEAIRPHLDRMLEREGTLRLLMYYRDYQGWAQDAVEMDLDFTARYGPHISRIALVNPPKAVLAQFAVKKNLHKGAGEKIFREDQLQEAIAWIKTIEPV